MNYQSYVEVFEAILQSEKPQPPYDNPDYLNYTKLNYSRMNRWVKTMELEPNLVSVLKGMDKRQHWIIILEPWCGDVAHSLPFLMRLAEQSPQITYDLQLRDSEPFLINSYLTNGTKSIPKLIVRDEDGIDLFTWGARPREAQQLMERLKAEKADFEIIKTELQNWYNEDKGRSLQIELLQLFTAIKQPNSENKLDNV
ncbi:MAG TPA: thioredoxin family protein [Flavisolibacter sp.]|nr:thioredoxin family protein [Flavisolibacter sp.]